MFLTLTALLTALSFSGQGATFTKVNVSYNSQYEINGNDYSNTYSDLIAVAVPNGLGGCEFLYDDTINNEKVYRICSADLTYQKPIENNLTIDIVYQNYIEIRGSYSQTNGSLFVYAWFNSINDVNTSLNYNFYMYSYYPYSSNPYFYNTLRQKQNLYNYNQNHTYSFTMDLYGLNDIFYINMYFDFIDENMYSLINQGLNNSSVDDSSKDYIQGYNEGQSVGYSDGYSNGLNDGREQGYQQGLNEGATDGYNNGFDDGYNAGEQAGISEGRQEVIDQGQTASVIFNGIISVGLLPTNVFLRILNFEVFGINIGALVSSLLTILVIIIIVRTFLGGSSSKE